MKAIRVDAFGGSDNLRFDASAKKPSPADNEILIQVMSAGVNPVDTYIREGVFSSLPSLPFTPGWDCAGVVESVGSEIQGFKPGDRVYTIKTISGAYADYTTASPLFVGHLSDHMSFAQGASIGVPYYTAYKALFIRAQPRPGQTVLIHGASGSVGTAALQMGKAFGLKIIGTAGTMDGINHLTRCGADLVFNHRHEGYMQELKSTVGGVDIVLEMVSHVNLQKDLEIMNYRGKIVVIGCRGPIEINPRAMMGVESQVMGVALLRSTEAEWKEIHAAMEAGQKTGWLKPHLGKVYPLKEASQAQHDVIANDGVTGKLTIDLSL